MLDECWFKPAAEQWEAVTSPSSAQTIVGLGCAQGGVFAILFGAYVSTGEFS